MPQPASYYRAAVKYNEELATFAGNLAEDLDDDVVKRWCLSVSRQHKFHAAKHGRLLARAEKLEQEEAIAGGGGSADPEDAVDEPTREQTIEEQQAEYAAKMEAQTENTPSDLPDPTETPEPVDAPQPDPAETPEPVENAPSPDDDLEPGVETVMDFSTQEASA